MFAGRGASEVKEESVMRGWELVLAIEELSGSFCATIRKSNREPFSCL